jgi:hypothetical protein
MESWLQGLHFACVSVSHALKLQNLRSDVGSWHSYSRYCEKKVNYVRKRL